MAQANLPEMPAGPVLELYGQRKRFTVPVGLKCLLEELTREVLRDQPTNIYEYLADYLEKKLEKECGERKRRKSWDEHRWSWEAASLLTDTELGDFLETHGLTFSSANRIATIIQAAYRGFRDRQRVKEIKTTAEKDELYLEYDGEDAYITKDCYGNIIRFTPDDVERILLNYRLTMEEANKYAIKIQRTFRGYRTRESFAKHFPGLAERLKVVEEKQRKLSELPPLETDEDQDELSKKATKIQSAFRGFKARKDVQKKKEEIRKKMSRIAEFQGEDFDMQVEEAAAMVQSLKTMEQEYLEEEEDEEEETQPQTDEAEEDEPRKSATTEGETEEATEEPEETTEAPAAPEESQADEETYDADNMEE